MGASSSPHQAVRLLLKCFAALCMLGGVSAADISRMQTVRNGTDGTDGSDRGYQGMHTHNWAFHFVNKLTLQPKLDAVFGQANLLTDIFARELAAAAGTANTLRVLSIGSGDCSLEILLGEVIRRDFNVTCVFTCFDPSDEGFLAATRQIAAKKSAFKVIRQLPTEGSFDAAFAHHALHHVGDLETLFTFVRRAIGPDGVFVISDMIGRNGHQRWPEAKRLAERLFSKLPSVLGAAPRDFIMRSDPPSPPTPALLSRAHMYTRDAGAI